MATAVQNKNKVSVLAKDFGMSSKDVVNALKNYTDTVKGPSQVLDERELSILFEYLTQKNQVPIASIFADTYQEKKPEQPAAKSEPRPAAPGASAAAPAEPAQQPAAPTQEKNTQPMTRVPEKKIVDTRKATNVNLDKYDEKLQDMADRSGGGGRRAEQKGNKEKFRSANKNKGRGGQPTFSNKRKQEEAARMRRLQLEALKKTPLTVKIPEEISVQELASRYDTRYLERTFDSTLAGEITIKASRNDYGYTVLQEDEAAQIREDIESRKHVTREPVYLETNSWGNPYYLAREGTDDLNGTYIEVDLTAQHVWYYKDGEVYTECDCVSGDVTDDHGTQTGCFPLAYKESPSVLTGGTGDSAYEEKVNYWMPFFEGQGLHDATWRYYFGGNIYRGNGSHGCVNLPLWAAQEIYEAVDTGTAIIIFYE